MILLVLLTGCPELAAQQGTTGRHAGIMYTAGSQQAFPFNSPDYLYDIRGIKAVLNLQAARSGIFTFEVQAEPGVNRATHQLLNQYFVQPDFGPDYLEKREEYTKEKTITEYVINFGFQARMHLSGRLSVFLIASIGPMYSDTGTERLAEGFAFSDIIAAGVAFRAGEVLFELRPGLRHVSNADLRFPNSGHNSTNIDFSAAYCW